MCSVALAAVASVSVAAASVSMALASSVAVDMCSVIGSDGCMGITSSRITHMTTRGHGKSHSLGQGSGFGSNKKTRYLLPSGYLKFTVNHVAELELLMMHNKQYAAEVAHNVSARKRQAIVQRAEQLGIKVTNAAAKLRTEESE